MRSAPLRQAAILINGPATLLPCGNRPFLAWMLRELSRFGVEAALLLITDAWDDVTAAISAIQAGLPKKMAIRCLRVLNDAGTGGALFHVRENLEERFLVCRGTTWLDFNLARLLADAAGNPAGIIATAVQCRVVDQLREAGIYYLDRSAVDGMSPVCSLERDVLPALAATGALRAWVAAGWFIDLAIPADRSRAASELPVRLHRRALFLDRDGVINVDHGWVGTRERFEFMPGALAVIRAASDAGWHVFVVTNQSGIARGLFDEADFARLTAWMTDTIRTAGGTIDDLRYCPFHPEAPLKAFRRISDWRKPAPGMILDLLARWQLDASHCVLVGDQETDMQAAAAAGMPAHRFVGGDLAEFVLPLLQQAWGSAPNPAKRQSPL